jgi:ketosteroid isomerase-like protein
MSGRDNDLPSTFQAESCKSRRPGAHLLQEGDISMTNWWQQLFDAIDRKDTAAFLGFLAEDAVFQFGNAPPARGRAAIGVAVSGFFGAIGGSRHHLQRSFMGPDARACQGEVSYTRLDGSTVTVPFANVLVMRGELIAGYHIYIDLTPLFAA